MNEIDREQELCALCGNAVVAGTGTFVLEGTACATCGQERAARRRRALVPLALVALLLALAPFVVSYAHVVESTPSSVESTRTLRVLFFTSSTSDGFRRDGEGDGGPITRSYSDPVAMVLGGAGLLVALVAAGQALQRGSRPSMALAAIALGAGGYHLVHGAGLL